MEERAKEQEALAGQASGKAALEHVIAAVELYMQAALKASSPAERARLNRKCGEIMAYGEQLKAKAAAEATAAVKAANASSAKIEPAMSALSLGRAPKTMGRELPKREQVILWRASRLGKAAFPPWESDPPVDAFARAALGGALFEDDYEFSMSLHQNEVFAGWKRPHELFPAELPERALADQEGLADRFMTYKESPDLVQDATTDCSIVASLCAIAGHVSNGHGTASLLAQIMHPYDHAKGRPMYSENGKYVFRMYFNGTFRHVFIDDRLPSSTARTLFVVDCRNPALIWPALLEKAYLKVHGGYDFPGSNSGTDIWVLTGWIPEQIFLQSSETNLDRAWARTKNAYERGDVMVTLGTGRLSAEEEAYLGLAALHNYAVLGLREEPNGVRQMLVKNPWRDNFIWRGGNPSVPATPPTASQASSGPMTGAFWIGFDDVIQYYESLYLNWNPSLFQHQLDHHFNWTLPSRAMSHSLVYNPQFSMQPLRDGTVWILLNRHFQDAELDIARKRLLPLPQGRRVGEEAAGGMGHQVGFISLYVFAADGKRVLLPDRPRWIHRSPLVDSPQCLLCFEARKAVTYTIVVAQSKLPLPSYSFTLSFLCPFVVAASAGPPVPPPLRVEAAADALRYHQEVTDSWSRATAGGSAASPDFVSNPQYALTLPGPTAVTLLLCAEADDVPVRVDLVWARGQRVASLAVRDLVVSSGEYQRGSAMAVVAPGQPLAKGIVGSGSSGGGGGSAGFGPGFVDAGTYTVVVSTFEPGQHTKFTLRVSAAVPVTLDPIPAEDAGKFRLALEPLMLCSAQGHDDDDDADELCRRAVLLAPLNTRVSLVVQAVEQRAQNVYRATAAAAAAASTAAVRVSVERLDDNGGRVVASGRGGGRHSGGGGGGGGSGRGTDASDAGNGRQVLGATGGGQFQNMIVAGLRTGEVHLGRASPYQAPGAPLPRFQIVVRVRNGRPLARVGLRVDVLSSDRVQVGAWEDRAR